LEPLTLLKEGVRDLRGGVHAGEAKSLTAKAKGKKSGGGKTWSKRRYSLQEKNRAENPAVLKSTTTIGRLGPLHGKPKRMLPDYNQRGRNQRKEARECIENTEKKIQVTGWQENHRHDGFGGGGGTTAKLRSWKRVMAIDGEEREMVG